MKAGWYSENQIRSYPFVRGTLELPKDAIVDAGFLVAATPTTPVRLVEAALDEGEVVLTFTFGGAPAFLVFRFDPGDVQRTMQSWSDEVEESESESESESEDSCESYWSGFVVVGDLAVLVAYLTENGTWAGGEAEGVIEPALIQDVSGGFVSGVTVVNADRTRATSPEECDALVWAYETGVDHVVRRCVTGDIRFADGYNIVVTQNPTANELVFNAGVGLGRGLPCEEVQAFPDEEPPVSSSFYSGGPSCFGVVRRINAAPGPTVQLRGNAGVQISPDPENHTLVVDVTLTDLLHCMSDSESESEEA